MMRNENMIEPQNQQSCQNAVSDSYSWLKKGITAYTFGAILTPVEIEILEADFENKIATVKTEFQEGKLDFDRIYKTASECDFL